MLGRLYNSIMVMVVDRLAVMALAKGDDSAHIATLHGIIAVLVHQGVRLLHPTLVILSGSRALVVHNKADALLMGVFVQCGQIEVRIRCEEVKDKILLLGIPVFPTDVPAFDKEGIKTVFGGKVDVTTHVGIVGTVGTVGFGMSIVGLA